MVDGGDLNGREVVVEEGAALGLVPGESRLVRFNEPEHEETFLRPEGVVE